MMMTPEEQMYLSAVRYALPRMTYIVGQTVDFMKKQNLGSQCINLMITDIETALESKRIGMEMDKKEWISLLVHLKNSQ